MLARGRSSGGLQRVVLLRPSLPFRAVRVDKQLMAQTCVAGVVLILLLMNAFILRRKHLKLKAAQAEADAGHGHGYGHGHSHGHSHGGVPCDGDHSQHAAADGPSPEFRAAVDAATVGLPDQMKLALSLCLLANADNDGALELVQTVQRMPLGKKKEMAAKIIGEHAEGKKKK